MFLLSSFFVMFMFAFFVLVFELHIFLYFGMSLGVVCGLLGVSLFLPVLV